MATPPPIRKIWWMRRSQLTWLAVVALGCSSRTQTGDALIATGTAAAVIATAGQARLDCEQGECVQRGKLSKPAAAVVAGGLAATVAGHALKESARGDTVSRLVPDPDDPDAPRSVPATYTLPRRDPAELAAEPPANE